MILDRLLELGWRPSPKITINIEPAPPLARPLADQPARGGLVPQMSAHDEALAATVAKLQRQWTWPPDIERQLESVGAATWVTRPTSPYQMKDTTGRYLLLDALTALAAAQSVLAGIKP